jgi:O-antigen/teichoic acid export membrane protein
MTSTGPDAGPQPHGPPANTMQGAFLRGSAWSLAERWGAKVATILTFIVLGRLLEPVEFGLAALALVLITLINVFTDFGASAYLIQQRVLTRRTTDTAFWGTVLLGVFFYGLLWLLAPVLQDVLSSPGLSTVLRVFGLVLLISPLASMQASLLIRDLRFASMTARTLISTAAGAVVALSLATNGFGVWALVGQQLAAQLVSVAVLWRASPWRPGLEVSLTEMRRILGYGSAIAGTTLLEQGGTLAPSFLVGTLLGPRTLGYYAVGSRLPLTVVELFTGVFGSVSVPVFAKLKGDRARLAAAYRRSVIVGTAVTTVMLLLLSALSPLLVPLLFGDGWERAVPVAQLAAVAFVFGSAQCFDRGLRLALDRQRLDLLVSLVGCLTMLVVLLAVGRYGLLPLLLGQVAVEAAWWALSLVVCCRLLGGGGVALALRVAHNLCLGLAAAGVAHLAAGLVGTGWLAVLVGGAAGLSVWLLLVAVTAPLLRDELWRVAGPLLLRRGR